MVFLGRADESHASFTIIQPSFWIASPHHHPRIPMLRWIDRFLKSSIGRKALMAATGLLLVGFLVAHLAGNLSLYKGEGAFDEYAHFIGGLEILPLAELGLGLLFIVHIYMAVRTTMENRNARPIKYGIAGNHGKKTVSSMTMFVSGLVVLIFLIKHLWDFRLQKEAFEAAPTEVVQAALSQPFTAIVYILGAIAIGFHIFHAFSSAFQTLGLNHPKYTPALIWAGRILGVLLALGFASFPLFFWLGQAGSH